jgi:O-acetyl-ADP-ribose deacetylase (regulator of RNase III)
MIIVEDDILKQTSGLIIHGCNAQGVMGSGLALQIKNKYPEVYTAYKNIPVGEQSMGAFQAVRVTDNLHIGNCITQLHFGRDGKKYASVIAIKRALNSALFWCDLFEQPLHAPEIGCGLGGLTWDEVGDIFENTNKLYPNVQITIFRFKP